jgi:hypothetical protein
MGKGQTFPYALTLLMVAPFSSQQGALSTGRKILHREYPDPTS